MRQTYCEAEMKFVDVTARDDSTVTSSNKQSFSDLSLLDTDHVTDSYATLERNMFVLDGSKKIMDNPVVAYMSKKKTGENCLFADSNPMIEIRFTQNHTSAGLMLKFFDDYPIQIKVTWYSIRGTKIKDKIFYPDKLSYTCREQVENYGRIRVEFIETRLPNQNIKLESINYGIEVKWSAHQIKTANMIEEVDMTSATLSINTANISILDEDNDFDIENEDGAWKSVQKTQEVSLSEYIDGEKIHVGTFFIDDKSFSGNIASFSMIDTIGLMDNYIYNDGEVYQNVKAGTILESIFSNARITKYEISDDVYNIRLSGALKIQTCREALQMVCFACGAVADDSRSDTVHVYKPDKYVRYTIPISRKFYGSVSVGLREYVSGVSVEYEKFVLSDESKEIFKDVLPVGKTRIEFPTPYLANSITSSKGTIVERKTNYVVISMSQAEECVVSGIPYETSNFRITKNVPVIDAAESENVKEYSGCTLYSEDISSVVSALLKHFELRQTVDLRYILETEHVGNWVNINNVGGKSSTTLIASQNIDLSGGFLSTAKCVGYSIVVSENFYTGNELYTGGGALL